MIVGTLWHMCCCRNDVARLLADRECQHGVHEPPAPSPARRASHPPLLPRHRSRPRRRCPDGGPGSVHGASRGSSAGSRSSACSHPTRRRPPGGHRSRADRRPKCFIGRQAERAEIQHLPTSPRQLVLRVRKEPPLPGWPLMLCLSLRGSALRAGVRRSRPAVYGTVGSAGAS